MGGYQVACVYVLERDERRISRCGTLCQEQRLSGWRWHPLEVISCGVSSAAHPGRLPAVEGAPSRGALGADGQHNRSRPGRPWPRDLVRGLASSPNSEVMEAQEIEKLI
jgi:hypothetical protein